MASIDADDANKNVEGHGDSNISIMLPEDLTNVAFWLYCNKIANSKNSINEEIKKLAKLIQKFCMLSLIILVFQLILTILITNDIYT